MTVGKALGLCPEMLLIPPDRRLYQAYSQKIWEILDRFSPAVEPFSIDEAWVDLTGCPGGDPVTVAGEIQQTIRLELGLPCSVGLSANKLLAKMASEMEKPEGLTVLHPEAVAEVLWPMPTGKLFGVGARTAAALARMGILTIGDLARTPPESLVKRLGKLGRQMIERANGRDGSPVRSGGEGPKSVGQSLTLPRNLQDLEEMGTVLAELGARVARRLRAVGMAGKTVTVTFRTPDFKTFSRAVTLPEATQLESEIHREALRVLVEKWPAGKAVRLLGVSVSGLKKSSETFRQSTFWDSPAQTERALALSRTLDHLDAKFGEGAVRRGTSLTRSFHQVK
jgi:DNA polymerase-4